MEWIELVSTYVPANEQELTAYDSFRRFLDNNRTIIIFIYLVIVYYLGFATRIRLPILKTILLYVSLFIGAIIFSVLDVTLPVKGSLFVAVVILVIVRVRSRASRAKQDHSD